ncbi:hypothetical protein C4D60_Mb07t17370 [Musa balbisiana]|uniref:phospholipase A2 n=1 Tax=Musa balbisiana TaxID=52838 RepID=A0A4S8JFZ7_MUSBA|nr:hypothetical protein C4D60_Mb07t17370 [Musa balbisiana]
MHRYLPLSLSSLLLLPPWGDKYGLSFLLGGMGTVLDSHFLALTAIVTVGYQFLFFVITALLKFDKVTDFAGSTNFVILAILTLVVKGSWHFRQIVLTILVALWGLRLGVFLLMRILQWGEDRRFDEMRNNLGKLAVFWIFQAVWVWTVSLPLTIVNASDRNPSIKPQDIIGWIMWSIGISIEATADQQKLLFKNSPANKGKWCNAGVWKYSRHPNYFGEGAEWLVVFGPIFLTLLLLFVSGIPLLEESADKRFGSMAEYRIYKNITSPLVPLPPAVYGRLPAWFKVAFLFEFPLYSRKPISQQKTKASAHFRERLFPVHPLPCVHLGMAGRRTHSPPQLNLAVPFLALLLSVTTPVHGLNIGVRSVDPGITTSKQQCSRKCESDHCTVPPFLRYGKYCGILYSGCPGEKPCDALDACCMVHDACVQAKHDYLSQECNENFLNCIEAVRASGKGTFRGNKCMVEEVMDVITLVIEAALLAGRF